MKKILCMLLVCVLAASLIGCGAKKRAEDKAAEEILKQNGVDADVDGEKLTISGPDGQKVVIGGGTWPDSALGKSIPAFTKGRIDSVVETEDSLMMTLYEVEQDDAKAYIEENKPAFPLENMEMSAEGMISWGGVNEAGLRLALTHQEDWMSITLKQEEK